MLSGAFVAELNCRSVSCCQEFDGKEEFFRFRRVEVLTLSSEGI